MMFLRCALLICCIFVVHSLAYTLTSNDISISITQRVDPGSRNTFYRISANGEVEKLTCPPFSHFDGTQLKCVFDVIRTEPFHIGDSFTCPEPDGYFPAPYNCFWFYQCSNNLAYRRPCGSFQTFSTMSKVCGYAQESGCCEYLEVDSELSIPIDNFQ